MATITSIPTLDDLDSCLRRRVGRSGRFYVAQVQTSAAANLGRVTCIVDDADYPGSRDVVTVEVAAPIGVDDAFSVLDQYGEEVPA